MVRKVSDSPYDGTVYYRQRSVLVLAPSFVAPLGDRTHQRASIRCMVACSGTFEVETAHSGSLSARAVLMSPAAGCLRIEAHNVDFALFDFAVASAEYLALQTRMQQGVLQILEPAMFDPLTPRLLQGQQGELSCYELGLLMQSVVEALTGEPLQPLQLDERVMQVMGLIEKLPLAEIKLPRLASAVNLSAERLRHLFKAATGSTLSQYARTTAVWRALALLKDETRTITDVSHTAGFHDVSHFYRVYSDLFGISLSEKNNIRKYRRVRCFE